MNAPVVLLHSSASSARQWQGLAELLRACGREVHALDFHGHGARPAWGGPAPMRLADEVAPIERLLEVLGGAQVVGHSYGGAVALKLACRRPSLVRSLVVYEPVMFSLLRADPDSQPVMKGLTAIVEAMRASLAQGLPQAAAQRFIDLWSGDGAWASLAPERQQAFAARMPVVLQHFDALFGDPFSAGDLARLDMPLRLFFGARTVPPARRIAALVHAAQPRAGCKRLDGMGHMGPVTHAATFNRRVAEFLFASSARRSPAGCGGAAFAAATAQ